MLPYALAFFPLLANTSMNGIIGLIIIVFGVLGAGYVVSKYFMPEPPYNRVVMGITFLAMILIVVLALTGKFDTALW